MPSIQGIAKKTNTRMFKETSTRPLDEVLPLSQKDILPVEEHNLNLSGKKKEFRKVPYRPWDDDAIKQEEAGGKNFPTSINITDNTFLEGIVSNTAEETLIPKNNVEKPRLPGVERNSPRRIIISLYGVQRNILKFLIENISYEEESYAYTFPIDLKSIMLFTSASKNTVETSLRRMKEKTIIESWDHKRGRGGYVAFRIPNILKEEFHNHNNKPIHPMPSVL
jgi:hypothetical protein